MSAKPTVYLAGPECFSPDSIAKYEHLSHICKLNHLTPIVPLANEKFPCHITPAHVGKWVAQRCKAILSKCDFVLANVSPFRSVSADVGTAVEIGLSASLNIPIYAYSSDLTFIADKLRNNGLKLQHVDGQLRDENGLFIEEFDMSDNCMIHRLVEGIWPDADAAIKQLCEDLRYSH